MSNFNFISEIHKIIISTSIIFAVVLIFSVQKMQKYEIHFEIKYFDEKFNLSKNN